MTTASSAAVAPSAPATIHEAELAPGVSGVVWWGQEIDQDAAIARRQAGQDVVVRGDDLKVNRAAAQKVEAAVGPYLRGVPHTRHAGPNALPHFQQVDPDHGGHTFYETPERRARKKP